ncbi:hypothetical protein K5Q02_12925 [Pseudomonas sp. MM211]|uniref:hypothetical protein n=1 Tax=Pseudomonas sp. MM211 TaxID=2866808 RepID=UPI001CEC6047|nr:hypothetical protein [Pseudomonas sp. MM211]UCJ14779.1 hypothetical protein K5Q02_12925 [Pseudomonas sp. MM211]
MSVNAIDSARNSAYSTYQDALNWAGSLSAQRPPEDEPSEEPGWNTDTQPDELPQEQPGELPQEQPDELPQEQPEELPQEQPEELPKNPGNGQSEI